MITQSIARLQYLCDTIPDLLLQIGEPAFSAQPAGKWSPKQIIGHLIDSATNNHHRFIRGQFEDTPLITYDPDKWNDKGYYQQMDGKALISFWAAYNRHLLTLLKHIPADQLNNQVNTGGGVCHTLEFVINDYVVHLEHHLHEVLVYQ